MVQLDNICKTYNSGKENECKALKNVSLQIQDGEMVAVIGKSGAGKSTLMHILSFVDRYEQGSYILNGKDTGKLSEKEYARLRNKEIGIVIQDYALIEEFTALQNVMIPLNFSKERAKTSPKQLAINALELTQIGELKNKPVNQLSGGQKQRVAIARAIVNNPSVILADEPTGALDSKTAGEIIDVFRKLNKNGKTVIVVTHDKSVAEKCDRIIEIADGEIVSDSK